MRDGTNSKREMDGEHPDFIVGTGWINYDRLLEELIRRDVIHP